MHTARRLAGIGVGVAMLAVGAAHGAGAATPTQSGSVQPNYIGCTMTVGHPTAIYKHASFTGGTYHGGKHTGQKVTASYECSYFDNGFHDVRLAGGGTGYIYAADLVKPRATPSINSRYSITGTVNVRNAPSTSRGAIIGHKSKGAVVRSPLYKDDFSNNGFAEVLLGNGNIGWISSAYVD